MADDPAYRRAVRDYLAERVYTKAELDEWLRPKASVFAVYDPLIGYRNANRRFREGLDDSYVSYHYDADGARRMVNHAGKPCRINTYGSSFTDCEQVQDAETWQERLAAHIGEPVRNYGVGGQTGYHSYVRMQREQRRTPTPYVIVNLTPPYERQLFGWQAVLGNKSAKHPSPPMPYVRVNRAKKQFEEVPNPAPTREALYRFCDLDYVSKLFQDDFGLHVMVAHHLLSTGRAELAYRPTAALARAHGIDRAVDSPQSLAEVLNALFEQEGVYAAVRTIDLIQTLAERIGTKVLYILTYATDVLEATFKTGRRFDQDVLDHLKSRKLPYVDVLRAQADDFARYRGPFAEWAKRYFIGHVSPTGNLFVAHAIKDGLARLMDPKPPAYRVG